MKYEIIYDYCSPDGYTEESNIRETFEGTDSEMQDQVKQMRANGCYHIAVTALEQD